MDPNSGLIGVPEATQKPVWVQRAPILGGLGIAALVIVLTVVAGARTQQMLNASVPHQQAVQVSGPVEVKFNQEVAKGFAADITPVVKGSWSSESHVLGVSTVSFRPESRFLPGQKYVIHIGGLKRVGTGAAIPAITESFQVQTAAGVESGVPAIGAHDVQVEGKLSLKLASKNQGVRTLKATLEPGVPLKLVSTDDQTFVWAPQTPLKQGSAYTFTVEDLRQSEPAKRVLYEAPFGTVGQPTIWSARQGKYFTPGQTVDIVFDRDMKPETAPFVFNVGGKGNWTDARTYRFTPTGIQPGNTYVYTVKAGLHSKAGGVLEADHPFTFSTNGPIWGNVSPGGGGVSLSNPIRISFDQAVDHASAQAHFGVSPWVAGSYSWSGNTMIYTPSGMAYQTTYTFGVSPGVAAAWGLPNDHSLGGSFATVPQVVKLNVPAYTQQHAMTCEASSLRMLLAYRGINVSDMDIVNRMGYNPRPRDTVNNFWDDPNQMYVGFVDGATWTQGYGVHAGPIAAAGRSYGRSAVAYFGISAQFIATSIYAANPVEFWGHLAFQHPDAWNSPNGVVQTAVTMHGRVVTGVVGSAANPVGFYVNDPWGGKSYYMSASDLIANMNGVPGVSNQAVVVY